MGLLFLMVAIFLFLAGALLLWAIHDLELEELLDISIGEEPE